MLLDNLDDDTLPPASCNAELGGGQLDVGHLASLPCDHFHHYYHYQSCAQYLWLAETCIALEAMDEALTAYEKALFQDHFCEEAKKDVSRLTCHVPPIYDKHPLFDIAFCSSVGELPTDATALHDAGVHATLAGDIASALAALNKAITLEPGHSNSYFARGKCWFMQKAYAKARNDFAEAIHLSHIKHDAYHQLASDEHTKRAQLFLAAREADLAIADFSKALDLNRRNKNALAGRAAAYRSKGRVDLAEADEKALG
jgi:tetratricopeptide (TPR) repeat protein